MDGHQQEKADPAPSIIAGSGSCRLLPLLNGERGAGWHCIDSGEHQENLGRGHPKQSIDEFVLAFAVFRICICLIRIQPKISIRIRIPDPGLFKFILKIIFSFLWEENHFSSLLLLFSNETK
jgi:hypothetical protein